MRFLLLTNATYSMKRSPEVAGLDAPQVVQTTSGTIGLISAMALLELQGADSTDMQAGLTTQHVAIPVTDLPHVRNVIMRAIAEAEEKGYLTLGKEDRL